MALSAPAARAWSEYDRLVEVALHRAGPEVCTDRPHAVLFSDVVDLDRIGAEHDALQATFRGLGVRIQNLETNAERVPPNLMFVRDLFAVTPAGTVLATMFNAVRKPEVAWAERTLLSTGARVHRLPEGATFEGADLLWITPRSVLIGVGNRTNEKAANALQALLADYRITVEALRIPIIQIPQHLLGYVQIVDRRRALVRTEVLPEAAHVLRRNGFEVIPIAETDEVVSRAALNLVTVAPGKVVMAGNCPDTRAALQRARLEVVAEVDCRETIRAGGGLACLTGIVERGHS